jgi:hypothetical protein
MRWNIATGSLVLALGCSSEPTPGQGGSIVVAASGESFATSGYAFPPSAGQVVFVVDGWEIKFTKAIVVIGKAVLNASPDQAPADPSQFGAEVASLVGPFAVNLSKVGDVDDVTGSSSKAWKLGTIDKKIDGSSLDTAERYAFSYDIAPASDSVKELRGIDASDADWAEMKAKGHTHFVIGTATFKGDPSKCKSSKDGYNWSKLPTVVDFKFGFVSPVQNLNCQNADLKGQALAGEEFQRGVQVKAGGSVTAQATFHLEHMFWQTLEHDVAAPHFDHIAAAAKNVDGKFFVSFDELNQAAIAPVKDASGNAVPWRSCVDESAYKLPTSPSEFTIGTEGNADVTSVASFIRFSASIMGHLNAEDGLCFVPGFAN